MVLSLLFDFGITSVLLLAAFFLRKNIRILQRLFLPAPLIAGVLGILLGPQVLGVFSPIYIQYSEYIEQTALPLLACVLCTQLFVSNFTADEVKKSLKSFLILSTLLFVQVLIGISFVRVLMPGANDAYGLIPFTSYSGGPGVCTITSNVVGELDNFSVETANSIGNTYATLSMLTGVIIGMFFINVARRKGILAKAGAMNDISKEEFTGYVETGKRVSAGEDLTNGNSLNTMTLHFAIAGMIIFIGVIMQRLLTRIPALNSLAITIPVIIAGFIVGQIFKFMKWDSYVDCKSIAHFSAIALEYLIASTIANTNINVFMTHGTLIIATSAATIIANVLLIFGLGKLWNRKHWFENSIGLFGVCNGIAATGLLLLRTTDPDDTSGTMSSFCTAFSLLATTTQLFYVNIVPMWTTNYGNTIVIGTVIAMIVCLVLGFAVGGKSHGR